jgi:hypothetical protein
VWQANNQWHLLLAQIFTAALEARKLIAAFSHAVFLERETRD